MASFQRFKNWLSEQIDGTVLGLFRLIFGVVMVYELAEFFKMRLIDKGLLAPKILFKYEGFEWVKPASSGVMNGLLFLMLVCAVLLATGVFMKWACRIFAVVYGYFFLCDKSLFNNHIYLFFLLLVLLSFTNADDFLSLKNKTGRPRTVARWQVFMLQAQFLVVYFFGGLAKMNADWLFRQEPVRTLTAAYRVAFFQNELSWFMLTWGGFLIDLLAPLLLLWKPARRYAIWGYLLFHLTNTLIFDDIGIFPLVMALALVLFYETSELRWLKGFVRAEEPAANLKGLKKTGGLPIAQPTADGVGQGVKWFLIGWFVFQLLFPLRGYFLPNDVNFTGIGKNFSWRMKIDSRVPDVLDFNVENPANGQRGVVDIGKYVNTFQVQHLAGDVRSVAALARLLKADAAKQGFPSVAIRAEIRMTWNGRKGVTLVDSLVDLSRVEVGPLVRHGWVSEVSN